MGVLWNATTEPVWRWLHEPWTYPVPQTQRLQPISQPFAEIESRSLCAGRENEWEAFAGTGPDVPKDDVRVVPLGTPLAVDETLVPAVHLAKGEGLWRDPNPKSEWQSWRKRDDATGA